MEENITSTELTAEQILNLFQQFTLNRPRLIPPEYAVRLQQQLDHSEKGSGERIINFQLLIKTFTILVHRNECPTMSELSMDLDAPLSTVTRFVDCLVRANLLERIDDPHDRRLVRVRLTQTGREIYQDGIDHYKSMLLKILAIYTPVEQEQLIRLMGKFVNALKA